MINNKMDQKSEEITQETQNVSVKRHRTNEYESGIIWDIGSVINVLYEKYDFNHLDTLSNDDKAQFLIQKNHVICHQIYDLERIIKEFKRKRDANNEIIYDNCNHDWEHEYDYDKTNTVCKKCKKFCIGPCPS